MSRKKTSGPVNRQEGVSKKIYGFFFKDVVIRHYLNS